MKTVKKSLPMGNLRALIDDSSSINEENRTVELIWSTGFKGLRSGWEGSYNEELSMDPKHVDLSRLKAGAPLLAAHDSRSLNSVIGVVEKAWLEGNQGKALVRFAKDDESDKIYQKVKDKILRNVSVGYAVRKYEDVTEKGDLIPTLRATNWQPGEISIVPMGFDPSAQVRSESEIVNDVEISSPDVEKNVTEEIVNPQETRKMSEQEKAALALEAAKQAKLEEKTRQQEIRMAVRSAKLDESYADELITADTTSDEARKLVLAKLAAKQPEVVTPVSRIEVSNDNSDARREIFETALLTRVNSEFKHTDQSKLLHGKSVLRQIESFIPRNTMESDANFAKRTMTSSDLPLALANVAEKGLQKSYDLQPRTFEKWSRKDTLRNYKEFSQVKAGDYSSLALRPENAEFTIGSSGEKNEVAQLKDYGKIHSFSSQMLVNDDLGLINRLANQGGVAASRLENRLAYLALSTNKTMKDSVALYHATHANLGTAAAITQASVAEAYKLMRKQKSTDGLDALNLAPAIFVCGPDQESTARQFFASVNAQQTSNVNIYSGTMEVIVDAELSGNQFYFIANPSVIDTVVCYHLEGQESPKISSRVDFMTSALQLKIEHAFAAEPMDWRGIVKNAGL